MSAVGTDVTSVKTGDRVAWTGLLGSLRRICCRAARSAGADSGRRYDQQAAATMLQGMTAHYLSSRHLSAEERRDCAGTRGSRRSGTAARRRWRTRLERS